MIGDGDRVLVCLSGGKDSLSLLHTLRQYQYVAKKKVCIINKSLSGLHCNWIVKYQFLR